MTESISPTITIHRSKAFFRRLIGSIIVSGIVSFLTFAICTCFTLSGVSIDLHSLPPGSKGFYPYDGNMLWMGREGCLQLPELDRSKSWICVVTICTPRPPGIRFPKISFQVGGEEILIGRAENEKREFHIPIPASSVHTGATLSIISANTFRPGPTDALELGAAITSLNLQQTAPGAFGFSTREIEALSFQSIMLGILAAILCGAIGQAIVISLIFSFATSFGLFWVANPFSDPLATVVVLAMAVAGIAFAVRWLYREWVQSRSSNVFLALAIFALSCATWVFTEVAGFRSNRGVLDGAWQVIDPMLLKSRLLESLWYLHSQPPLFNLMLGIIEKGFPVHDTVVLSVLYLSLVVVTGISLLATARRLSVPVRIALPFVTLFFISPAFLMYSRQFDYTLPLIALQSISSYFLVLFAQKDRPRDAALFFFFVALIALFRSLYHLVWVVTIVFALLGLRWRKRWTLVASGAGTLGLVSLWYAKNFMLFGIFTASSWMGMNLERVIVHWINNDPQFIHLLESKQVSPLLTIASFQPLEWYRDYYRKGPPTGVPILDQEIKSTGAYNFHSVDILRVSQMYTREVGRLIRAAPGLYLQGCLYAVCHYFQPGSDLPHMRGSRDKLGRYALFWERYLYGRISTWIRFGSTRTSAALFNEDGLIIILCYLACFLYGAMSFFIELRRHNVSSHTTFSIAIIWITLTYVLFAGTLFERKENMRFRFEVEPLLLLILSVLFTRVVGATNRILKRLVH